LIVTDTDSILNLHKRIVTISVPQNGTSNGNEYRSAFDISSPDQLKEDTPKRIYKHRLVYIKMRNSLRFIFLPCLSIFSVGSEPMERKQMRGVLLSDSSTIASIDRITASAN